MSPAAVTAHLSTHRSLRHAVVLAVGGALIGVALPSLLGVGWTAIVAGLRSVGGVPLAALLGVWLLGLLAHTITLTNALPGLTHRRALTMSLTGSAVANVLPLGGAAGVALNHRMCRAWGIGHQQFATYTVVTNVWDVLAKLTVPAIAVIGLVSVDTQNAAALVRTDLAVSGAMLVLAGATLWAVCAPTGADALGRAADTVLRGVARVTHGSFRPDLRGRLVALQAECSSLVRARWRRLTAGMLAYQAMLALLLWACLSATGAHLPLAYVLTGFAVDRVLTLVNLTPGGVGVVELGLAGALGALGGDAGPTAAGVLLYRALTFGLEIPVGGALLLGWLALQRRTSPATVA